MTIHKVTRHGLETFIVIHEGKFITQFPSFQGAMTFILKNR